MRIEVTKHSYGYSATTDEIERLRKQLAEVHDLLWRGHAIVSNTWSDKCILWCGDVERYFSDHSDNR